MVKSFFIEQDVQHEIINFCMNAPFIERTAP